MEPHIYLYYSGWCGHCNRFKAEQGPWEKLKSLPNVKCHEIEVTPFAGGEEMKYFDPSNGAVPQIAVVVGDSVQRHIGYTKAETIINLIPTGTIRGSGRRKSGRRRKSSRRCFDANKYPSILAALEHVLHHCKHIKCKNDPIQAVKCAQKCCL